MAMNEVDYLNLDKREPKFDTPTNGLTHNVPADCTEGYLIVSCYGNIFSSDPTLTITGCTSELVTRRGSYGVCAMYWIYKITNLSSTISVGYSTGSNQHLYTGMQIMY